MFMETIAHRPLQAQIERILASTDPSLDMTVAQAAALRDAIADADLFDDAALTAYDLLHSRTISGRAF